MKIKLSLLLLLLSFFKFFGQTEPVLTVKDNLGNTSLNVDCSHPVTGNISLSAELPEMRHTTDYEVTKNVEYKPYPFNTGTKQNSSILDNNSFFKSIDIGFDFWFYGNHYTKLVLGSNGVVTFDQKLLGQSIFNFSQQNPSVLLPFNSIFGVLQEGLVFEDRPDAGIYTQLVGNPPYRKLVISYYNGLITYDGHIKACENLRSTTQIVLHESSNKIEILVDDKPLPCSESKFKNSLIGIMNGDGTKGVSPKDRNTGVWSAKNESYLFTPIGTIVTPVFSWYDSKGNLLGTSPTLDYKVTGSEVITLKASYPYPEKDIVLSDEFPIQVSLDYPLAKNLNKVYCEVGRIVNLIDLAPEIISGNLSDFTFKFYTTSAEAVNDVGTPITSVTLDSQKTVYARVESKSNPGCFTISTISLNPVSSGLQKTAVEICDPFKNNFGLAKLRSYEILPSSFTGTVKYYLSADSTQPVTQTNLTDGMNVWISLNDCPQKLGPITINLKKGPAIKTPVEITETMCDNNYDGSEKVDFKNYNSLFLSNPEDYIFKYYTSYNAALAGGRNEATTMTNGINKFYVRVEYKNMPVECFSIGELIITVEFNKAEAKAKHYYICFDGTSDVTVDLTDTKYSAGMSTLTPVFYKTYGDADKEINPITSYTLTQNGFYTTETVYARFKKDDCWTIRELFLHLVHPEPVNTVKKICDNFGDAKEKVNLQNFTGYFFGGQSVSVKYFDAAGNPITTLDVTSAGTQVNFEATSTLPFEGNQLCKNTGVLKFELEQALQVNPEININLSGECDNNSNGYEIFNAVALKENIIAGSSGYSFVFYENYDATTAVFSNIIPDPANIKIYDKTQKKIYVKVTSPGGCYSMSVITVNYNFAGDIVTVHPAKLEQCSLDNVIDYDLSQAIPQMFIQAENNVALSDFKVEYFKSYNTASETVSDPLPSLYTIGRSRVRVYARFLRKNGCYYVAPIDLITYLSPVSKNPLIEFCTYDGIKLSEFQNGALLLPGNYDPTAKYVYTFYKTDPNQNPNAENYDASVVMYPQDQQKVYYKVEVISNNNSNCSTFGVITFQENKPVAVNPVGDIDAYCDVANDGKKTISLRQREADFRRQFPDAIFTYYTDFPQNIIANPDSYNADIKVRDFVWAKISTSAGCPALVKLNIRLKPTPYFQISSPQYFCESEGAFILTPDYSYNTANNIKIAKYEWTLPGGGTANTPTFGATKAGIYHLKITAENGCTFDGDVELRAKPVPEITKLEVKDKTVIVYGVVSQGSNGVILYKLDNGGWQASNVFNNVEPGVHEFYVKYSDSDCAGYGSKTLVLAGNNVITPNGDGLNEKVVINNLDIFKGESTFQVFDRYGKLLHQQQSNSTLEWNGYFNGRPVSTGTYWYILKIADGRELTGWIMVKDR